MAMRWIERELRRSGLEADEGHADEIAKILKARGRDIPLPKVRELWEREKWRIERVFDRKFSSAEEFIPVFNEEVGGRLMDEIRVEDIFLCIHLAIADQPQWTRGSVQRAMNGALRNGLGKGTLGELRATDPEEILRWRSVGRVSAAFLTQAFREI